VKQINRKKINAISVTPAVLMVLALLTVFLGGCSAKSKMKIKMDRQAMKDSFFETTRFIMTKEEKNIYRHLMDKNAKKRFREEFWEKRDPSPETEENENKLEYQRRIEFANKWFNDRPDGRGFDTERGHLLLQLGYPDQRETRITTERGTTRTIKIDFWYYYRYDLFLQFIDRRASGQYRLRNWPPNLLYALDRAMMTMDLGAKDALNRSFNFKAKFKAASNTIDIKIPVKNIDFEDSGDTVKASFHVRIYIYRDYNKIHTIEKDQLLNQSKDEILKLKYITFAIPYTPTEKGKYLLEVVIRDPVSSFNFRNFAKFKM
jgi:GWxTD domain-containing protein